MSNFRFGCVFAAIAIASAAGSASAGSVAIHDADRGWFTNVGKHTANQHNVYTGVYTEGIEYRSFFQFDISGLSGTVTNGSFSVVPGTGCEYSGGGCLQTDKGSETVTFYDVSEAGLGSLPVTGSDEGNQAGISVFNDLGSGESYGEFTATGSHGDAMPGVSFEFNTALMNDLNRAIQAGDRTFVIGAALTSLTGNMAVREAFWNYSTGSTSANFATLNVEYTDSVAAVPLPASLPLLGGAFAALGFAARRRKRG